MYYADLHLRIKDMRLGFLRVTLGLFATTAVGHGAVFYA